MQYKLLFSLLLLFTHYFVIVLHFFTMEKPYVFFVTLVFLGFLFYEGKVGALKSEDGLEEWGYVQVRPSKPNILELCNFNYCVF